MPLHSLVTAERVLLITLVLFYSYQVISGAALLKSKIIYICTGLTLVLAASALVGTYGINLYEVFRLILIIWTIPFLKFLITQYGTKKIILISLSVLAIHGVWGILQFIFQKSLGLNILGESVLSVQQNGVAKFLFSGQKLIRSYGPYAHPNSFSAALLAGIILLFNPVWNKNKKINYFFIIIFLIALLTTFSRAALIGLFIFFIFKLSQRKISKNIFLISLTCVTLFSPLYFYRTTDPEDRGFSERQSGAHWALQIINNVSWWRGVGPGNYEKSLLVYLQKNKISYQPWEIQPVHSIPLLFIAEWGKAISFLLGIVLAINSYSFFKRKKNDLLILFLAATPLMLFDHYLLTQTAPLVWLLLALQLGLAE